MGDRVTKQARKVAPVRGPRGLVGRTGAPGHPGPRGPAGPAGPIGPEVSRADVLAMVEDQFAELRKEVGLQLTRMGQIQVQLDQIQTMLKRLVAADV